MTHKITDAELSRYLEAISKPELIDWLMGRCQEDEKLRSSLLDLATPREKVGLLVEEIRGRMEQALQQSGHRDGYRLMPEISRGLDDALVSIQSLIDRDCPVEAEQLLADFVGIVEKCIDGAAGSYEHLWFMGQRAVTSWGQAWAAIAQRAPQQLALLVYGHIHANNYNIKDDMIPAFTAALGSEGLRALQRRLRDDLDAQAVGRDTHDGRRIAGWLKQIADGRGDVDEYIAIVKSEQQEDTEAVPVARRLFAAGRLQEALTHLERPRSKYGSSESYDYPRLKSQILAALGRMDEARKVFWNEFASYPSMSTFESILELTPDAERAEAYEKAAALAEGHDSPDQAAHFLVQINRLSRAARLIQQREIEISGGFYSTLTAVAKALAQDYPLEAWKLYRILLLDILNDGRSRAYHHAADHLVQMEQLANAADIQPQQADFLASIRKAHGRKSSFWATVKTDS